MWYGIILFTGLVLLSIGIYKFYDSLTFVKTGERVPATVVELESRKDSDGDISYRPVFVYRFGNEERRFKYSVSSSNAAWEIGEKATLVVMPGDSGKVMLLTYFGVFSWTIVLVAIALPLIFISGGYYWANSFLQKLAIHT